MEQEKLVWNDRSVDLDWVQKKTEEAAALCGLSHKDGLRLMLLAEEMLGIQKVILGGNEGEFYIEHKGSEFRLHLISKSATDYETKLKFEQLATKQENYLYRGLTGKIRMVCDLFMTSADFMPVSAMTSPGMTPQLTADCMGFESAWRLSRAEAQNNRLNEWDGLEESVIARLADEIIVGHRSGYIEFIVVKKFA